MTRPAFRGLAVLAASLVACSGDPAGPIGENDGVPNIGSPVHSTPEIFAGASMAWVDPDERIAFRSWDGERTHIKVLNPGTGEVQLVDGPASLFGGPSSVLRQLVARSDGETIYYVIFVDDADVLALRSAELGGAGATTLDPTGGYGGLALAPDGSLLAHVHDGALASLDMATMQWTALPGDAGAQPITFSADGSELLVLSAEGLGRARLIQGTVEPLDMEAPGFEVVAARWDEAGIRVLAADETGAVAGFTFLSGAGPAVRSPLGSFDGSVGGGVLAGKGDAFAIWTDECIGGSPVFGGCGISRITVHVGRFGARAAPTALGSFDVESGFPARATSALLFSTDGSRLYYALGGVLYVVDVP